MVNDSLRDHTALSVCCGSAHTVALCRDKSHSQVVFAMGLNSCGQLGIGRSENRYFPTAVSYFQENAQVPVAVFTKSLSMHTFVQTNSRPVSSTGALSLALPFISLELIQRLVTDAKRSETFPSTKGVTGGDSSSGLKRESSGVRAVCEAIATAFSSPSILNASFHVGEASGCGSGGRSHLPRGEWKPYYLDLASVVSCYEALFLTNKDAILSALRKSTLHSLQCLRCVPPDLPENLSVYLTLLLNPLMLYPDTYHVAIDLVLTGLCMNNMIYG